MEVDYFISISQVDEFEPFVCLCNLDFQYWKIFNLKFSTLCRLCYVMKSPRGNQTLCRPYSWGFIIGKFSFENRK